MSQNSTDILTLRESVLILRRQGRLVGLTTLLVMGAAALYLSLATPLYTSEALILVDPSPQKPSQP